MMRLMLFCKEWRTARVKSTMKVWYNGVLNNAHYTFMMLAEFVKMVMSA